MAVIGKRARRSEAVDRVTGAGLFADDLSYTGMLHAAVVRSPVARGHIKSVDTRTCLKTPGVVAIFTAADIPGRIEEFCSARYFRRRKQSAVPGLEKVKGILR